MGTITWHFHVREVILENLSMKQKAKAGPFFLIIVIQKSWVLADLCSTVTMIFLDNKEIFRVLDNRGIHWLVFSAKALPICLVIICEMVLHLAMSFPLKTATLGSIANLTTLWRPTHDESINDKCLGFYKYETILSSLLYLFFSLLSLTLNCTMGKGEDYWFWPHTLAIGLSCTSLLVSQLYLAYFQEALFPTDVAVDPAICKDILTARKEPLLEVTNQTQPCSNNSIRRELEEQAIESTDATATESIPMTKLTLARATKECKKDTMSDSVTHDLIEGEDIVSDHIPDESHFDRKEDAKSEKGLSNCSRFKQWLANKRQSLVMKLNNVLTSIWRLAKEGETWVWAAFVLSLMFVVGAPGYHFHNMQGK